MTKSFNILKKPLFLTHFWPIFPIFGAENFFLENPAVSRTILHGFLASCLNLEKTNDTIPRKCLDRRKDGRKDGQTLFYRTLLTTARVPKKGTFLVPFFKFLNKHLHQIIGQSKLRKLNTFHGANSK